MVEGDKVSLSKVGKVQAAKDTLEYIFSPYTYILKVDQVATCAL